MAKSDPEFLARLDRESREAEKRFIGNIAHRLGRPAAGPAPVHPYRGAPDFWASYELGTEEKIGRFMDNCVHVGRA
jgi:L-lactate dehydrogenase complex protein LldG